MAGIQSIIQILADTKQATQSINKFANQSTDDLQRISKAAERVDKVLSAFTTAFKIIASGIAIFKGLDSAIGAAIEQENAINDLNVALQLTGKFSKSASESMIAFADSLQATTIFQDDQILSSAALLQNIAKLDTEGLKKATQGAADLSAIFGKDLTTTTRALAQAFAGNTAALSKYGIKIKEGANASETAGKIFEKLSVIQGAAAAKTKTFDGAVTQLTNSFKGLLASIGLLFIKNSSLVSIINKLSDIFVFLSGIVKKNSDSFIGFSNTLAIVVIKTISKLIAIIDLVISPLRIVIGMIINFIGSFKIVNRILRETGDTLAFFGNQIKRLFVFLGKTIDESEEFFGSEFGKKLIKGLDDFSSDLQKTAITEGKKLGDNSGDAAVEALQKKLSTAELFAKLVLGLNARVDITQTEGLVGGIISSMAKGFEGARDLFTQVATVIGGPIVGAIFDLFSQGPEKVQEFLTAFFDSIPVIIQNLVESIPVFIRIMLERLPSVFINAAITFVTTLVSNIPEIVKAFVNGLIEGAKRFVDAIIEQIPVVGGGSGFIGSIFGFQEGGRVPNAPQFEGDRFPAKLSANEQVLSSDLTDRLENFLNGNDQRGQNLTVNIQLGEQQLASVLLNLQRQGFRTA